MSERKSHSWLLAAIGVSVLMAIATFTAKDGPHGVSESVLSDQQEHAAVPLASGGVLSAGSPFDEGAKREVQDVLEHTLTARFVLNDMVQSPESILVSPRVSLLKSEGAGKPALPVIRERRIDLQDPTLRFAGMPAGNWILQGRSKGWLPIDVEVSFGGSDVIKDVEIPIEPTSFFRGVAIDETTSAPVRVRRIVVAYEMSQGDRQWMERGLDQHFCEPGSFAVGGIAQDRGAMTLAVEADGYETFVFEGLTLGMGVRLGELVALMRPMDLTPVSGLVLVDGAPTSGVHVRFVSGDTEPGDLWFFNGQLLEATPILSGSDDLPLGTWDRTTDAKGGYSADIPAGTPFKVVAWTPDAPLVLTPSVTLVEGSTQLLSVGEIQLWTGASLEVRVRDGRSEGPLPTTVRVQAGPVRLQATVHDGVASFSGLPPGSANLRLFGDAGGGVSLALAGETIELEAGRTLEVELLLGAARPGRVIRGYVRLPDAPEIEEWMYLAVGPGGHEGAVIGTGPIEADGSFILEGVAQEKLTVSIIGRTGRGSARALYSMQVGDPSVVRLDADLTVSRVDVEPKDGEEALPALFLKRLSGDLELRSLIDGMPISKGGEASITLYGLADGEYSLDGGGERRSFVIGSEAGRIITVR